MVIGEIGQGKRWRGGKQQAEDEQWLTVDVLIGRIVMQLDPSSIGNQEASTSPDQAHLVGSGRLLFGFCASDAAVDSCGRRQAGRRKMDGGWRRRIVGGASIQSGRLAVLTWGCGIDVWYMRVHVRPHGSGDTARHSKSLFFWMRAPFRAQAGQP